jgi:hypothetical protein
MHMTRLGGLSSLCLLSIAIATAIAAPAAAAGQARPDVDFEAVPYAPKQAICYRTPARLSIDGKLDEPAWRAAPWSDRFIDIEGDRRPRPAQDTRIKMLWDDEALYVGAELLETDIWGTITERDAVIFRDNDVELFIDPDDDTHAYYELEVNVLKTAWDLMLVQPYRDGGPAITGWDIAGLQVGVDVRGTVNRPGDRDEGWTVELAIPWKTLREAAIEHRTPKAGEQWRINFSRVEWQTDVKDGAYQKRLDPKTGKPFPEDNWVWSPQGAINMHMPERWGFVQFSDVAAGAGTTTFVEDKNDRVKWALRRLYYRQRKHRAARKQYASDLAALDAGQIRVEGLEFRPSMQVTPTQYEISAPGFDGAIVHLRQDGKVWITP